MTDKTPEARLSARSLVCLATPTRKVSVQWMVLNTESEMGTMQTIGVRGTKAHLGTIGEKRKDYKSQRLGRAEQDSVFWT